jgi:hypothetical protein
MRIIIILLLFVSTCFSQNVEPFQRKFTLNSVNQYLSSDSA